MAKDGFFPPKDFEKNTADYTKMMADPERGWVGTVPGNDPATIAAIEDQRVAYVSVRQRFEATRLAYEEAKKAYVDLGLALWTSFYEALEHARTKAKKDELLASALEKYKRVYKKAAPPTKREDTVEEK